MEIRKWIGCNSRKLNKTNWTSLGWKTCHQSEPIVNPYRKWSLNFKQISFWIIKKIECLEKHTYWLISKTLKIIFIGIKSTLKYAEKKRIRSNKSQEVRRIRAFKISATASTISNTQIKIAMLTDQEIK